MRLLRLFTVVVCAASLVLSLVGQSTNGTISGLVLDPNNRVIVGADVVIVNDATGVKYIGKTNAEGI